jgi:hypothetical protein
MMTTSLARDPETVATEEPATDRPKSSKSRTDNPVFAAGEAQDPGTPEHKKISADF